LGLQNKNENYYWSRWRSPRRKRGPIITVSRQELVAFSSFSFRFAFHNFENVMKAKCALWLAENEKDTAQVLLVFFFSSSRFCCYWQPRFSWLNEMVFVVGWTKKYADRRSGELAWIWQLLAWKSGMSKGPGPSEVMKREIFEKLP